MASSRIAIDKPMPICFISSMSSVANTANTETMTAAALAVIAYLQS